MLESPCIDITYIKLYLNYCLQDNTAVPSSSTTSTSKLPRLRVLSLFDGIGTGNKKNWKIIIQTSTNNKLIKKKPVKLFYYVFFF